MSDRSGLSCSELSVVYGHHVALDEVSIRIAPGEIVVILGANGAGKSSLLKAIAGLVPIRSGAIHMNQHPVNGMHPHTVVEYGLALVPEGRGIFGDLTVEENLKLGAHAKRARASEQENLDRVYSLFPKLVERRRQIARTMSGGEQQMVAIGRAMMSAPVILMLDEPSLGLSPLLCGELFKTLRKVRDTGLGILLVEQNARQSLAIADRGYLLENGRITSEDAAQNLMNDPAVQKAYLGGAGAAAAPLAGVAHTAQPSVSTPSRPDDRSFAEPVPSPEPARSQPFALGALADRHLSSTALLGRSIGDLVRSAEARSRDTIQPARPAAGRQETTFNATPDTTDDVQAVLRRIEQAAEQARNGFVRAPSRPSATGEPGKPASPASATMTTASDDAALPEIEIYRKPTLEVYRRERDEVTGREELKLIRKSRV